MDREGSGEKDSGVRRGEEVEVTSWSRGKNGGEAVNQQGSRDLVWEAFQSS